MCGRYLIEEEAYSDILEILYRSGTLAPISDNDAGSSMPASASVLPSASSPASALIPPSMSVSVSASVLPSASSPASAASAAVPEAIPPAMRDAMIASMHGMIGETVPGEVHSIFRGVSPLVTNGEVFPTNFAPVLTIDGPMAVKWGFPHWKNSNVIINARSETALEKNMFRKSLLERRCVILSNGFYEWGESGSFDNIQIGMFGSGVRQIGHGSPGRRGRKTKYLFRRPDESKLYMAGFWSTFTEQGGAGGSGSFSGHNAGGSTHNADSGSGKEYNAGGSPGKEYNAFVILTTAAGESVSPIHNRMPLILSPDETEDWLNDISFVQYALLRPGPGLTARTA